ncbi:MAG: hypothetical protein H6825_03535 [Planctomycetes bacterium]|nr:hypothetical protein [Planctomycetota bacterium]
MTSLLRIMLPLALLLVSSRPLQSQVVPIDPMLLFSDSSVGVEDGAGKAALGGHTSTVTTSFSSSSGVSGVSVTYTNVTTGDPATTGSHSFGGAKTGSYHDQMPNTKAGDVVRVVKVYELSNGQTITKRSTIVIQ